MKIANFLLLGISLTATLTQAETLCGKSETASFTEVCVVRNRSRAESVSLGKGASAELYRVTGEDDVHSGGRVSELTLTDASGGGGSAVVNWEEGWVEGYSATGERFSAKDLSERSR